MGTRETNLRTEGLPQLFITIFFLSFFVCVCVGWGGGGNLGGLKTFLSKCSTPYRKACFAAEKRTIKICTVSRLVSQKYANILINWDSFHVHARMYVICKMLLQSRLISSYHWVSVSIIHARMSYNDNIE